jgi:hypothetical protein
MSFEQPHSILQLTFEQVPGLELCCGAHIVSSGKAGRG